MISRTNSKHAGISNTEICHAWNIPPIIKTTTSLTGTIHHITLISTQEANYVLRAYRYTPEKHWRIGCEHEIASYVRAHSFPAIAPLPLATGETILEHKGHFYALFPFAHGVQIPREQVTSPEVIAAMGHCLGALHHVLTTYPHALRQQSLTVDPQVTFEHIDKIESVILEKTTADDFDQQMLAKLRQRKDWLLTADAVGLNELASLEQQALHGDYQETNLFFKAGTVSAIIDWDQAYIAPRAWEVLRTLHYVFQMDTPRCQKFLRAYRNVYPLSCEEIDITARAYGWVQANNLWAYSSYYLDNNPRVRHFLHPSSSFTPFQETWARIAKSLR